MSQPSERTCTVAFSGSMGACERYGASYTASTFFAAPAKAPAASPALRMDIPGLAAKPAHSCRNPGVDTLAHLPSSHWMTRALRPSIALQVLSAITATPFEICTTFLTPGTVIAFEPSKLATLPSKTGQRSNEAYSIPGRRTSSPNPIEPLIFPGVSRRLG